MSADRFRVQLEDGFIQFQGWVIPMTGLTITASIAGNTFPVDVIPAADAVGAEGLGRYRIREQGLVLDGVTTVVLTARNANGVVVKTVVHEIPPDAIAP
jgi:hypothetical protein